MDCEAVIAVQTIIDALGHTEVVDKAVAPTYENTGLSETTFNNCMKKLVKDNKLTKTDKGKQAYYDIKTNLKEMI